MVEPYSELRDQLRQQRHTLTELRHQLAGLADRCASLGARLARVGRELEAGALPADRLEDELSAARSDFAALRARAFEVGQALPGLTPRTAGDIRSVDDLKAWLGSLLDAVDAEEKRLAFEGGRRQALMVLDGVLALSHRDGIEFPPLLACQAEVRDLHRLIMEAEWSDLPSDTDALTEGKHPLAALLTLVTHLEELDDDKVDLLRETVTTALGRTLAAAAYRGKLRIWTVLPGPGEESPAPREPAELPLAPAATEPPAVVGSEGFLDRPVAPDAEGPLLPGPELPSEETELEVESAEEEAAAEPVGAPPAQEEVPARRREIVAVYIELRGYDDFTKTHKVEAVMSVMQEYYDGLGTLIEAHGGSLSGVTGQDLSVVFDKPEQAENTIRMALAIVETARRLVTKWSVRGYRLGVCVGIAQDSVRTDLDGHTDSGDLEGVVDLAARHCSEAKFGQIVVSKPFLAMVEHLVEAEATRELVIPGYDRPVTAYKLLRLKS